MRTCDSWADQPTTVRKGLCHQPESPYWQARCHTTVELHYRLSGRCHRGCERDRCVQQDLTTLRKSLCMPKSLSHIWLFQYWSRRVLVSRTQTSSMPSVAGERTWTSSNGTCLHVTSASRARVLIYIILVSYMITSILPSYSKMTQTGLSSWKPSSPTSPREAATYPTPTIPTQPPSRPTATTGICSG